jgi:hypothetical protein
MSHTIFSTKNLILTKIHMKKIEIMLLIYFKLTKQHKLFQK